MINLNKHLIPLAILAAGVIIGGAYFLVNQENIRALSPQEAAERAIKFINQTVEEDVTASLLDVAEENGLYRIHLKIENTEYNSYITKDGRLLFPNAFNLEEQAEVQPEASQQETQQEPSSLEEFAKCLADSGAKFYGAYWCAWCNKQKELFAEAAQYLPYVECSDQETKEMLPVCQEAGVSSYPTWEFHGEQSPGYKTFEKLAEMSGCSLE